MAQSLFDSIEDLKLPEDRPKRSYKKIIIALLAVVVATGLGIGGYFGYYAMFPKKLTQRPVPLNMEKLLVECCLELYQAGVIVGIQDLGAAGVACATTELAAAGEPDAFDGRLAPLRVAAE